MGNQKKRIFVSRELTETSPILSAAKAHSIVGQSLITFSPLSFERPEADWVFFYSRNAVKYFFEADNYALYPYSWACMSEGTADELSKYVMDLHFVGKGKPYEVAEQFEEIRSQSEVACFIRAAHSIDSVKTLTNRESDFSIPVYNNVPVVELPADDFDILIFTSPMNVNCWYDAYEYSSQKVIAIGETTANALSRNGVADVLIAQEPSEKAIAVVLDQCL